MKFIPNTSYKNASVRTKFDIYVFIATGLIPLLVDY
jgi:hypothetical protein